MQALIDFDGWRKWKDAAIQNGLKDASVGKAVLAKNRGGAGSGGDSSSNNNMSKLVAKGADSSTNDSDTVTQ